MLCPLKPPLLLLLLLLWSSSSSSSSSLLKNEMSFYYHQARKVLRRALLSSVLKLWNFYCLSSLELVFPFTCWRKLSGIWIAMNKVTIIGILTVFIICSFYQKEFEVLNRHSWRCKEKLKHQSNKGNYGNNSVSNNFNTVNLYHNEIVNNDCCKCIYGKKCKRICDPKVHQRSCIAINLWTTTL